MKKWNGKLTTLVHGGIDGDERTGAVNVPIYQTSTYRQQAPGIHRGYEYSRTGNPTREALEKLIAQLEHGTHGTAYASGMAAITAVLMLFRTGDKLLISENVYGGTFRVLDKIFARFGIQYEMVDTTSQAAVRAAIEAGEQEAESSGRVQAILIESPANPLMTVTDIAATAQTAHAYGKMLIVDNTFMTPYLQRPLDLGADIVLHSATKYLGGHSDLIAGLVVVKEEALAERLYFIQNAAGGILQPFDSFLLIRGIKTLGLRMEQHQKNAQAVAQWLQDRPEVEKVYYPGLAADNGYCLQRQQADGPGAMISFELQPAVDMTRFLSALKLTALAESLGGVETLICHPASMTHAAIPEDIRRRVGITPQLLRLSAGIEDAADLTADIEAALRAGKG